MADTQGQDTMVLTDPYDFSGGATTAAEPKTAPGGVVTEDATPIADAPKAEADDIETEATADKADNTADDDLTPEEKALAGIDDEVAAKPVFDDNIKKTFKELFGTEDPEAFKSEYSRQQEQLRMLAEENQGLKALKGDFDKLPAHMQRALELERQKLGEGHRYLKNLPDSDVLAKDASKLSDRELLDLHVPDHGLTQEDWDTLKDPDADEREVAAIKKRIGFLKPNALETHKKVQNSIAEEQAASAKAMEDFRQAYQTRAAEELATVKNSTLKTFLTQEHINEIQNGTLVNRLFEADGITPKPGVLAKILKAEQYDKVREATQKAWYRKGKSDGLAEQTAGMPSGPRTGRAATPAPGAKQQPLTAVLDNLEKSLIGR